VQVDREEEKQRIGQLEKRVEEVFKTILDNAQERENLKT
jgi:hypothetical protein